MAGEIYRSSFTENNLMEGNVNLVQGQFIELGSYRVDAGEKVMLGYGYSTSRSDAIGRALMDLKNDNAGVITDINGTVRFVIKSPQKRHIETILEYRTEDLRSGVNTKSEREPFPALKANGELLKFADEDKYITIEVNSDATITCTKANSKIHLDITRQAL
jgi:hypothetical protein